MIGIWPSLKRLPPRWLGLLSLSALAATILILVYERDTFDVTSYLPFPQSRPVEIKQNTGDGRLHLLVPATSTNSDLCKLLLSAQILGYPTPVLINYGAPEDPDPYKQHMGKVQGILDYLDQLPVLNAYDEDMVLVVDGYDIWFQLRPDVLLKRYRDVTLAADERVRATYGDRLFTAKDMRHSILFGPDKICWPIDYSRPACWAAPSTPLAEFAFGPGTRGGREELNDPRWLNSGTIMGPLQDMRDLFRATLQWIHDDYSVDSDQFYFAELFGLQEYARLSNKQQLLTQVKAEAHGSESRLSNATLIRHEPDVRKRRTEYHILIDGGSSLFQTLAFWKQFLVWMRPIDAWKGTTQPSGAINSFQPYAFDVPSDLSQSIAPFAALQNSGQNSGSTINGSWAEMELLYNVISGIAPVLIHFTGEKRFREVWWQRLWWQSSAKALRKASQASLDENFSISPDRINGLLWYRAIDERSRSLEGNIGGLTDRGAALSWNELCGAFEAQLFAISDDNFRHPNTSHQHT